MNPKKRFFLAFLVAALVSLPLASSARDWRSAPTILDVLTRTDGAQAVVAAVLVVDEAEVLDFSLAKLLDDRQAEVILLAPTNSAFAALLGLDPGALDGLSIGEVQAALPGLLPSGVGPAEVGAILLKHAVLPRKASPFNASEQALLRRGSIDVADGSEFPIGVGAAGTTVNYETTITNADFFAKNGVVHFIDTVILDGLL